MNPFMVAGALLCFGAAVWAWYHGQPWLALGYFAWAVADLAFARQG